MTPLEILAQTFKPIEVPTSVPRTPGPSGVYLLIDLGEIVYVGSSTQLDQRLYGHAVEQRGITRGKAFDSALWIALPVIVHPHYEGAFIRALCPRDCHGAPRHRGHDWEILDGFGISHLANDRWQERERRPLPAADSIAARLKAARKAAGMTLDALADRIGICKQAISHWERGRSNPTDENLHLVAAAIGVSAVELWSGSKIAGAA